jgi:hypothetical protein
MIVMMYSTLAAIILYIIYINTDLKIGDKTGRFRIIRTRHGAFDVQSQRRMFFFNFWMSDDPFAEELISTEHEAEAELRQAITNFNSEGVIKEESAI